MDNPYQASSHSAYPTSSGTVTQATLQALAGTKPWVRLCSIMGFIGAGFMILAGLAMITTGAVAGVSSQQSPGISTQQSAGLAALPVVMGVMYIVFSIVYLFPSLKLWKYGSAIVRLMSSNSITDLETALDQQRGFWKFVGILMIVMIAFMLLAIVGGVVAGVAGASRMSP